MRLVVSCKVLSAINATWPGNLNRGSGINCTSNNKEFDSATAKMSCFNRALSTGDKKISEPIKRKGKLHGMKVYKKKFI